MLNFSSKFICFYGKNGAGKTNILEAISLFSSERGLRKALISDFTNINSTANSWNLELILKKDVYKTFLATKINNNKRIAFIDGAILPSLSKLEDFLWLLWITPSMDNVFITSKSDRRGFFDHLVTGFSRQYKEKLKKITSLQKERLHVILFRNNENWLNILEEKLAEEYINITKIRFEFLNILKKTFETHSSEFLRPIVKISGIVENIIEKNSEENSILEIMDALKQNRIIDSEKQSTQISIFKTNWSVYHPKSYFEAENCSTGEQKAFLISLILAVTRIYQQSRTGVPILLFDDLMFHLDKGRRGALIDELINLNVQTFFTGSELNLFDEILPLAQIYHVENSICTEIKE